MTEKPYRLISISGFLCRLDYAHAQPPHSLLLLDGVAGEDGLLLPQFADLPVWKGTVQRGGE